MGAGMCFNWDWEIGGEVQTQSSKTNRG